MCRHKHESLSYDSSLNPPVEGGDCQKCLEAGGNTLPTPHQAAIFLLEPGKRPLGLESGHHFFDRLAPVVYFYPAGNCVASTSGTTPPLPKLCPIAVLRYTIQQVLAVAMSAPPCAPAGHASHARSQQLSHQRQTLRTRSQRLLDKVQVVYAKSAQLRTEAALLRVYYRSRACNARQISL